VTDLLLSPHNDDAELFAAYTCLRHRPHVVVCLKADVQEHRGTGITSAMREQETQCSMNILGCDWQQLPVSETNPSEDDLEAWLRRLRKDMKPERVWAPAVELGGHSHHNMVGQSAWNIFGVRVRPYMTYKRGFGRSKGKTTVIPTPGERSLKRQALNCYESQIRLENTAYWFTDESEWDREWLG
jgi:LmbE family N-acetylglucosaminyl deacetylase